jgi:hypothetical protein
MNSTTNNNEEQVYHCYMCEEEIDVDEWEEEFDADDFFEDVDEDGEVSRLCVKCELEARKTAAIEAEMTWNNPSVVEMLETKKLMDENEKLKERLKKYEEEHEWSLTHKALQDIGMNAKRLPDGNWVIETKPKQ